MADLGAITTLLIALGAAAGAVAQHDGSIQKGDQRLFPLGCYELPEDDAALKAMADAGINLVHCHSREDLDRVQAVGIMGVMPLGFQAGATDALRTKVEAVADHPALAVWEGPDEIVWNFTAYSGLHRKLGVHKTSGEWWRQTPEAVAYAEEQAAKIIPNMRVAVEMIRAIDSSNRPVWINEAQRSDLYYCRQYMDFIDVTGCDIYPVSAKDREIARVGITTDYWRGVGRDKPVYMVLQAFSWNELGDYYGHKKEAYPTFAESRFMAYDVIAHGARGILYWGSRFLKSDACRESVYAVTRELAALQPFLVAPEAEGVDLSVIEVTEPGQTPRVCMIVRNVGDDWLVALVNEDEGEHMGVVVEGLDALDGRDFHLLYGEEPITIARGELITRMQGHDVKVFATDRRYEVTERKGRDYSE